MKVISGSKAIEIDDAQFLEAFGRDRDYHDQVPLLTYLDRDDGSIIWCCVDDEDADELGISEDENKETREVAESDPVRYLLIPGKSHGDHHAVLIDFLKSDDASGLPEYRGSIGRWKKEAGEEDWFVFEDQRDQILLQQGAEWLRSNGLNPLGSDE